MRRQVLRSAALIMLASPMLLLLWMIADGLRLHPDSYAGLPRAQALCPWPWHRSWFHVIDAPGFVLGYSERWALPLWAAYRLDERVQAPAAKRPGHFAVDRRTLRRIDAEAYRGSGYDRGHLAPNYAMSRFHGREAQVASFRMSNIVPQKATMNQKLWQRLEEIETDVYANLEGPLWVVQGPVFDDARQRARLGSGVAIPSGFFRIWLREWRGGIQALAFIVPQEVAGTEALDQFLVSIDDIEARTGLDFFHHLPESQEHALESALQADAWAFFRHARRPPRY